jgi:hypothetical protein
MEDGRWRKTGRQSGPLSVARGGGGDAVEVADQIGPGTEKGFAAH